MLTRHLTQLFGHWAAMDVNERQNATRVSNNDPVFNLERLSRARNAVYSSQTGVLVLTNLIVEGSENGDLGLHIRQVELFGRIRLVAESPDQGLLRYGTGGRAEQEIVDLIGF
jgi:hypothetical protein